MAKTQRSFCVLFSFMIIYPILLFSGALHEQSNESSIVSLIIMGSDTLTMAHQLADALVVDTHFDEVVFLTGQRKLSQEETPELVQQIFTGLLPHNGNTSNQRFPQHQAAMMRYMLHHTELPPTWYKKKKIFIESPMMQWQDGEWVHAQPEHAVEEWLKRIEIEEEPRKRLLGLTWEPKKRTILTLVDNEIFKKLLPQQCTLKMLLSVKTKTASDESAPHKASL